GWILTIFVHSVKNRHKGPSLRIPVLFQRESVSDRKDISEREIVVGWVTSLVKADAVHVSAGFGVVISQHAGPDQAGFWRKTVFQSGVENVFSVVRPRPPRILLGTVEACQVKAEFPNSCPAAELVSGIAPVVAHDAHP